MSTIQANVDELVTIPPSELQEIRSIGDGAFGVVKKCMWAGREVAVKYCKNNERIFRREVATLATLSHPNIVQLMGAWLNPPAQPGYQSERQQEIYYVLEYADSGSLDKVMYKTTEVNYTLGHIIGWFLQMCRAVHFLHKRHLLHRDLKPHNLLLFSQGRQLKVCDFGNARPQNTLMSNMSGTGIYMAPEVISSEKYTQQADVYGCGVVLWELLARRQPYADRGCNQFQLAFYVYKDGGRPRPLAHLPESLWQLIEACWAADPQTRPTVERLVDIFEAMAEHIPGVGEPLIYPEGHVHAPDQPPADLPPAPIIREEIEPPSPSGVPHTPTSQTDLSRSTEVRFSHSPSDSDADSDFLQMPGELREYFLQNEIPDEMQVLEPYCPDPNGNSTRIFQEHTLLTDEFIELRYKLNKLEQQELECQREVAACTDSQQMELLKEFIELSCQCEILKTQRDDMRRDMLAAHAYPQSTFQL